MLYENVYIMLGSKYAILKGVKKKRKKKAHLYVLNLFKH